MASLAALLAFETLALLTSRLDQIAQGLVAGIAAAAFGHGVARGLFAVEKPQRRLVRENDATARCFHNHLVWASRVLGVVIPLQVIHKTLFAPLVITVATNALFAAAVAGFLGHLVFRLGRLQTIRGGGLVAATWIHPLALLLCVSILLALAAGYSGLAAFVALRIIVAAAVLGALYLLSVVTHTLFASIGEDTPKGQKLATSLGLSARTLGIGGALASAVIRVALVVVAFVLIIGPWEVSTADLFDTIRNVPFGFKIGELHLSLRALLSAAAALALILIITRVVQRWLATELLPRSAIDPSLALSIVTIFGYIGAITAITLALTGLGFDLQKIALIAGAVGRHRVRTAVHCLELRIRPDPAGRASDPRRRCHCGQGGGRLGAARARARNRDRDLRSCKRHYSEFGAHHRCREELDAREPAGPDRDQGRRLL